MRRLRRAAGRGFSRPPPLRCLSGSWQLPYAPSSTDPWPRHTSPADLGEARGRRQNREVPAQGDDPMPPAAHLVRTPTDFRRAMADTYTVTLLTPGDPHPALEPFVRHAMDAIFD